jgi:hypothetical protein
MLAPSFWSVSTTVFMSVTLPARARARRDRGRQIG